MLSQTDFLLILDLQKRIGNKIILGDFTRSSYQISFLNEEYNGFNLLLDISLNGSIEIKHTIQKRARISIPILRLDINGFHKNPPFEESLIKFDIDTYILNLMKRYQGYNFRRESHLHYYIENFNEKWAFPPEELELTLTEDLSDNIESFCKKFKIDATIVKEGLF